jgi:ketol-acid reductoisomerase
MSDSNSKAVTVAIIGAGEMGAAVGRRLREMGARVITPLRGRSAGSVERVTQAALEVVDDDDTIVR